MASFEFQQVVLSLVTGTAETKDSQQVRLAVRSNISNALDYQEVRLILGPAVNIRRPRPQVWVIT